MMNYEEKRTDEREALLTAVENWQGAKRMKQEKKMQRQREADVFSRRQRMANGSISVRNTGEFDDL